MSNDGQVLLLEDCGCAKLVGQLGVDRSVKLDDDQGVTRSSFERPFSPVLSIGMICSGVSFPSAGIKMLAAPARDVPAIIFLMRFSVV